MKIKQLHIYGFGKWQDQKWDFNDQQLSVIAGENEAGKSTIRAFILFMLFGLPPQQRKRYLPKRGGQLGGRMIIQGSDGQDYTIERVDNRSNAEAICYDQHGQKLAPDWLTEELNGVDRTLYNQIFNFDVFALQVEGGFSKEQLGEILLSIGMTGSDRIYQTEKQLNKSLDDQFKKGGSKPKLNQLIKQLTEQEKELKQLEDTVEAYQAHQEKSQAYQAEMKAIRLEIGRLKNELNLLVEQQRVYPAIETYHLNKQELLEYPEQIDFPEQGEERYKRLKETLQPLQADVEVIKRQLTELKSDHDELVEHLYPKQIINQIEKRLNQAREYQALVQEKYQIERQIKEKNQSISTQLNELQLNLTEADLEDLPLNYTTEQTWQDLAEQAVQNKQQFAENKSLLETLINQKSSLTTERELLETKTLSAREKEMTEQELEQINQRLYQPKQTDHPLIKQYNTQRIFNIVMISILLLSIILLLSSKHSLLNSILTGALLVVGGIFIWQQMKLRKKSLHILNTQTEEVTAEWHDRRILLMEKLTSHDHHRDQLLLVSNKLKEVDDQYHVVKEQLVTLELEEARLTQLINEEKSKFSFLQSLSVQFWPDLAGRLRDIIDLMHQRDQLKATLTDLKEQLNQFEVETIEQFGQLIKANKADFQNDLDQLKDLLFQQQTLLERKDKLESRLTTKYDEQKQAEAKTIPYQKELDELLALAKVNSEEDFIKKAKLYQQWYELKETQQEMVRQIKVHLPDDLVGSILAGDYLTKTELNAKIQSNEAELRALDHQLNDLIKKDADLQAILNTLAHSKASLELKHAFHLTRDKLIEGAKEWLINQLALMQIEKTKTIFQTSYLPVVLEKASAFFMQLTKGRYTNIDFDLDHTQLFILASDQQTYQLEELSQGTMDQLFVSIRLGISSWLAEHIQLPFLIDDGFVHFDQQRKQEMERILEGLSDVHQIIYFTKDIPTNEQLRDKVEDRMIILS